MSLDDIAESVGTIEEAQASDDGDRYDDSKLQQRSMDEYDGGWSADH